VLALPYLLVGIVKLFLFFTPCYVNRWQKAAQNRSVWLTTFNFSQRNAKEKSKSRRSHPKILAKYAFCLVVFFESELWSALE